LFNQRLDQRIATEQLLPASSFNPFPTFADREAWSSLPEQVTSKWLAWAEESIDYEWPALPAVRYMDYVRNGNRSRYEQLYFKRRRVITELLIGECIEGKGRFIEPLINGLWCLCEESYWVIPAHMSLSRSSAGSELPDVADPVIDLFAAETGGLLAWTVYLLKDRLDEESAMVVKRIRYEMKRRILEPFLQRDDFWWMGFTGRKVNNWNPWILSNCLAAFILLEEDETDRSRAVAKTAKSLDFFMDVYHPDGCCDEGPGYWGRAGASLFDCLELLYLASDGKLSFFEEPLVQQIGKYIYRAHIDGNYYVNFADGNARLKISADVVYRYGKRIGDSRMSALGVCAFQMNGITRESFASLFRILGELFDAETLLDTTAAAPYERDVWMADTQVFAAREQAGSPSGLYVAAKGGHNNESHNHNDIGHYIVYYNGHPFLIDAGVENYTSKTFSPRRYEIWTMQSDYHSVPTVNGVQQMAGASFRATEASYEANDDLAAVTMNIAPAYPAEAGIVSWRRTISLQRGSHENAAVEVNDTFRLSAATSNLVLNCLTLQEPILRQGGHIELINKIGETMRLQYDSNRLTAEVEHVHVTDSKLLSVWGDSVYRLKLKANEPAAEGTFRLRFAAVAGSEIKDYK